MRMNALVTVCALALAGCVTSSPYGNHLQQSSAASQEQMARDAAQQLSAIWPPAKTRIELHQSTPDAFGTALVRELRERGYATLEFNPAVPPAPSTSVPLRYVLDEAGAMYRLTVMLGDQSISRPYKENDGALVPAGYWVRKE